MSGSVRIDGPAASPASSSSSFSSCPPGRHEARMINRVLSSTASAGRASPWMARARSRAAVVPISYVGWRTTVRGGEKSPAHSWSSKPQRATSSGQRSPSRAHALKAPRVIRLLVVKRAVGGCANARSLPAASSPPWTEECPSRIKAESAASPRPRLSASHLSSIQARRNKSSHGFVARGNTLGTRLARKIREAKLTDRDIGLESLADKAVIAEQTKHLHRRVAGIAGVATQPAIG